MRSKTKHGLYTLILFFLTAPAYATNCNVNRLTVYGNTLRDLGTSIAETVKHTTRYLQDHPPKPKAL